MFERRQHFLRCDNKSEVSDAFLKNGTTNWNYPASEAEMEWYMDYIISHYEK